MTSTTSSSDVDSIKNDRLFTATKINGVYWHCVANLDVSVRIHSLGDFYRFRICPWF